MQKIFILMLLMIIPAISGAKAVSISREQAIQKVRELPSVRKYLFKTPHAIVQVDNERPRAWIIHVYQIKQASTATMNWYTVDKITGKIKREVSAAEPVSDSNPTLP